MNKHTLQTRLRSIEHYRDEEKKLQEALTLTSETKREIIKSLKEACDWQNGDVIFYKDKMFKVDSIDDAQISSDGQIRIHFSCFNQNSGYGFRNYVTKEFCLLSDLDKYKLISTPKKPE